MKKINESKIWSADRVGMSKQAQIVKLLSGLNGRYSKWVIWQDFIQMFAISIANAFPGPHREEREQKYLDIAKKYSKEELDKIAEMMALVVLGMEENPDQDFLGELFMQLELGSNWHGQFFTPYNVCQMMARMSFSEEIFKAQVEEMGFVGVNDPACGAGALLLSFANECRRKDFNFQHCCLFVAQDIDVLAGMMCYIQLSLMGCAGYVIVDDTLSRPALFYDSRCLLPAGGSHVWTTPMMYSDTWQIRKIAARMDLMARHTGKASEEVVKKLEPAKKEKPKKQASVEMKQMPEPAETLPADESRQLTLF